MKQTVALAAVLWLTVGLAAADAPSPKKAPQFALQDLRDSKRVVQSKDIFAGKTTLLSFFATWCKPCKEEIPVFRSLAERYGDRGFQVILISLDQDPQDVEVYLKSAGSGDLRVLWDEDRKVKGLYKVSQLPTNVRIDPDGNIGMNWFGYIPAKNQELETHLKALPKVSR